MLSGHDSFVVAELHVLLLPEKELGHPVEKEADIARVGLDSSIAVRREA